MQHPLHGYSDPSPKPDHAAAQLASFRHYIGVALERARAQSPDEALRTLERASTAFCHMQNHLPRAARNRQVDVRLFQPSTEMARTAIGAARAAFGARRLNEAIGQLRQVNRQALIIARGLGMELLEADLAEIQTILGDGAAPVGTAHPASANGSSVQKKRKKKKKSPRRPL